MNHLHFVQSVEPLEGGGLGRAALELNAALSQHGANSRLISTTGAQREDSGATVNYHRVGPTRAFFAPQLMKDAPALVADADLVHGHGFYVATNWIVGKESGRQGKPFVYHPHGSFEPWILARSRAKKRIAHWLFENGNFRRARLWRALTETEAHQIRLQGIAAPIVVCPNGLHLEPFDSILQLRATWKLHRSRRVLLFLARIHPKKGLDLLVNAWSQLPGQLRQQWEIIIAGPDELDHQKTIERLIREKGLQNEIKFIGAVSGSAKLAAFASADAFVLPSRSEGFSVAILEAMASRLPVLATTACNFPHLELEGGGWIAEPTLSSLVGKLRGLLACSEQELLERAGRARLLVERQYTWPEITNRFTDACNSIL